VVDDCQRHQLIENWLADEQIAGTLYKCTSTNKWEPYYTPYTYPHPLRGVTPRPKHTIGVGATMRLNEGATISIQ